MKFVTKFIRHYPPHLWHVAALPWEIKNSNFLQKDIQQKWKKMQLHFKYVDFNSSTRVTVYAECIYVLAEYFKYLSIRRHSCFFFSAGTVRSAAAC